MTLEKFDLDPTARKSETIIDEILEKIKGQREVGAIKGTLKDIVITEILRTENLNGEEKAHKLARYLKDDIENFIFNSNKDIDEEIKKDAVQYLQNYLLSGNSKKSLENLPDDDLPENEEDNKNNPQET